MEPPVAKEGGWKRTDQGEGGGKKARSEATLPAAGAGFAAVRAHVELAINPTLRSAIWGWREALLLPPRAPAVEGEKQAGGCCCSNSNRCCFLFPASPGSSVRLEKCGLGFILRGALLLFLKLQSRFEFSFEIFNHPHFGGFCVFFHTIILKGCNFLFCLLQPHFGVAFCPLQSYLRGHS